MTDKKEFLHYNEKLGAISNIPLTYHDEDGSHESVPLCETTPTYFIYEPDFSTVTIFKTKDEWLKAVNDYDFLSNYCGGEGWSGEVEFVMAGIAPYEWDEEKHGDTHVRVIFTKDTSHIGQRGVMKNYDQKKVTSKTDTAPMRMVTPFIGVILNRFVITNLKGFHKNEKPFKINCLYSCLGFSKILKIYLVLRNGLRYKQL